MCSALIDGWQRRWIIQPVFEQHWQVSIDCPNQYMIAKSRTERGGEDWHFFPPCSFFCSYLFHASCLISVHIFVCLCILIFSWSESRLSWAVCIFILSLLDCASKLNPATLMLRLFLFRSDLFNEKAKKVLFDHSVCSVIHSLFLFSLSVAYWGNLLAFFAPLSPSVSNFYLQLRLIRKCVCVENQT